jgi:hypothetical protein
MLTVILQSYDFFGPTRVVDSSNSVQSLILTMGVSGLTYTDFVVRKTIDYQFENSKTFSEVKSGAQSYAESWVSTNYPPIP